MNNENFSNQPTNNVLKPNNEFSTQTNEKTSLATKSFALQPIEDQKITTKKQGKAVTVVGFLLAFVGLAPIGLILSAVGRSKSKKANQKNGLAIAGIILNAIVLVLMLGVGYLYFSKYFELRKYTLEAKSNAEIVENYASEFNNFKESFPNELSDFEEGTIDGKPLSDYVVLTDSIDKDDAKNSIIYQYTGDKKTATGARVIYFDYQKDQQSEDIIYLGDADESSTFINLDLSSSEN